MNLKKLAEMLTALAEKSPENTTVYFGHRDGSGCTDPDCRFMLGEATVDENGVPTNTRLFCIGCSCEVTGDFEDDTPFEFDHETVNP